MANIERIKIRRFELPLQTPYKLAFGLVKHFDTLIVEVNDSDGGYGLGEATILNGYTDETVEGSWSKFESLAEILLGQSLSDASRLLSSFWAEHPFTVTAFTTAIEMAVSKEPFFKLSQNVSVPILGVLNARDEAGIAMELDKLLAQGFTTIKVKVGFDPQSDLLQVRMVQKHLQNRGAIRIDGNQGFSREQALEFVGGLNPASIELFEQPCHADDWESAVVVGRASTVPMMLDESIYGEEDIYKAAKLGCATYIKLKLMKLGSLDRLRKGLALIKELGMKPVLGNGVASDISCWMESLVARLEIENAGEMNGFLKPTHSILDSPLNFANGCVELERNFNPRLSSAAIQAFQVSTKHYP